MDKDGFRAFINHPWTLAIVGGALATAIPPIFSSITGRLKAPWEWYAILGVVVLGVIRLWLRDAKCSPGGWYYLSQALTCRLGPDERSFTQLNEVVVVATKAGLNEVLYGYAWTATGIALTEETPTEGVTLVNVDVPGPHKRRGARFEKPFEKGEQRPLVIVRKGTAERAGEPYYRLSVSGRTVSSLTITVVFPLDQFPKEVVFKMLGEGDIPMGKPEQLVQGSTVGVVQKTFRNPPARASYIFQWTRKAG